MFDFERFWGNSASPILFPLAQLPPIPLGGFGTVGPGLSSDVGLVRQLAEQFAASPEVVATMATSAQQVGTIRAGARANLRAIADSTAAQVQATSAQTDALISNQNDNFGIMQELQLGQMAISAVGFIALHGKLEEARQEIVANTSEVRRNTRAVEEVGASIDRLRIDTVWHLEQQTASVKALVAVLNESRSNEARQLVKQGELNFDRGFYSEAVERLTLALEFDNTDFFVHFRLALAFLKLGDAASAGPHLAKAVAFAPDDARLNAMALAARARFELAEANWTAAARLAEKASALQPDNYAHTMLLLEARLGLGESDVGDLARKALAQDPAAYYGLLITEPFCRYMDVLGDVLEHAHSAAEQQAARIAKALEESGVAAVEDFAEALRGC